MSPVGAAGGAAGDGLAAELRGVSVTFRGRRGAPGVQALRAVDLQIGRGETVGVVGESGSGKSTMARVLVGLTPPSTGSVLVDGRELWSTPAAERRVQMVFQDPATSLDPRLRIGDSIGEPLWRSDKLTRRRRVSEAIELVGLAPELHDRYPHELSGGQQQRVGIARALISEPALVAFDEPTSALDVSLQAQVLMLIRTVSERVGFASVFVSHDLAAVEAISDRIVVMYLGAIVEVGPFDALSTRPMHPYTQALRDAVPVPHPPTARERRGGAPAGEVPDPARPPSGCGFRTRCPRAQARCAAEVPLLREVGPGQHAACHFPDRPGDDVVVAGTIATGAGSEVTR